MKDALLTYDYLANSLNLKQIEKDFVRRFLSGYENVKKIDI